MIGTVSLEGIDHINRCATLGIFIGNKDFRSKGYGTEAVQLILEYGFKYLNLKNIKKHRALVMQCSKFIILYLDLVHQNLLEENVSSHRFLILILEIFD